MSFLSSVGSLFGWFQGQSHLPGDSSPSYDDVCQARAILKTLNLPTELVLQILDHAQYWPKHVFVTSPDQKKVASAIGSANSDACLCLDAAIFNNPTADPIRKGGETPKIQSLEFEIVSKDQGWTSENTHNTYATSSWLELSILRPDDVDNTHVPSPRFVNAKLRDPSEFHDRVTRRGWALVKRPQSAEQGPQGGEGDFAWYLQGNRVASRVDGYHVVWARDGNEGNEGAGSGKGFLTELKDGDRMLVWARAKVCSTRALTSISRLTATVGWMAMHRGQRQSHDSLWLLRTFITGWDGAAWIFTVSFVLRYPML